MRLTKSKWSKWLFHSIGALAIASLAACGGSGGGDDDDNDTVSGPDFTIDTDANEKAATIAQESADDYDDNVNGLITGATLKGWMDDWQNNRPDEIEGKLVILQVSEGEENFEYIAPDDSDVFTYLESDAWKESRSNGVIETISMVPSGTGMDALLEKYDIDPNEDMIVCAMGAAGGSIMTAGRCWYTFRYWGTPKEHLALLNGGNQWNAENNSVAVAGTASTAPEDGTASVKDLTEENFALQATLEDMIAAVPETDAGDPSDGIFVWDARGTGEYNPTGDGDFKNSGATQGHPNGALLLEWTNLLNTGDGEGYTFKSKSAIQDYLDGNTNGFMDATLNYVGSGNAYQDDDTIYTYCETTWRAMVTGFASGAILGLPTRFYDGAMYEWHSMANVVDEEGNALLPTDSPWRTDKEERSMFIVAGDSANVEPRTIDDPHAASANAIIEEDEEYKAGGN